MVVAIPMFTSMGPILSSGIQRNFFFHNVLQKRGTPVTPMPKQDERREKPYPYEANRLTQPLGLVD